jgi:hypothetical protein
MTISFDIDSLTVDHVREALEKAQDLAYVDFYLPDAYLLCEDTYLKQTINLIINLMFEKAQVGLDRLAVKVDHKDLLPLSEKLKNFFRSKDFTLKPLALNGNLAGGFWIYW